MASWAWKIVVIVINSIMLALGLVVLAIGIWALAADSGRIELAKIEENGKYSQGLEKFGLLDSAAALSIVVGAFSFFLAIGAYLGCWKEYKVFFGLCVGFLIFIMGVDIIIIILTAIVRDRVDSDLEGALLDGVATQYQGVITSDNDFSLLLDDVQVEYECCGINNYDEFLKTAKMWVDNTNLKVPKTCCKLVDKNKYFDNDEYDYQNIDCAIDLSINFYHTEPCLDYIKDDLNEYADAVLGLICALLVLHFLTMIVDVFILRRCRDGQKYFEHDNTSSSKT